MHQCVGVERHRAAFGKFADGVERPFGVLVVELAPFREVEMPATVFDMIRHEPRDRGDVAVQGPLGAVRVAVVARAFEDGGDLRRHGDMMLD